jgi:hypothetical protein
MTPNRKRLHIESVLFVILMQISAAGQTKAAMLSTAKINAGESMTVKAEVRDLAGDEVAQLYLVPAQGEGPRRQSLSGVQRLHLAPALRSTDAAGRRFVWADRAALPR